MATNTATYLGSSTYLPSSFVTPQGNYDSNPNWTQTPTAAPEATNIVEFAHDRLMAVTGYPHQAYHVGDVTMDSSDKDELFVQDAQRNEQSANFLFKNVALSQCTGIQLEQAILTVPPMTEGPKRSINLTNTLCGDFISDDMDSPRRMVFSEFAMNVPILIGRTVHKFNLMNFLPNDGAVGYYSLSQIIDFLLNAWSNFMVNQLGDSTFYCTATVDRTGPKIFFTSSTYGLNMIRYDVRRFAESFPNGMDFLMRHFWFMTPFHDTVGSRTGESFYIFPRADTKIQNNATFLTFHSDELTQFRRADSIAPSCGNSLIGIGTPGAGTEDTEVYVFRQKTLVAPKLFFDRGQVINVFEAVVRATSENGTYSHLLKFTPAEIQNISLTLIFRLW